MIPKRLTDSERESRITDTSTERLIEIWNMLCRWADNGALEDSSRPTWTATRDELDRRGHKMSHPALPNR